MQPTAFISHASSDSAQATRLTSLLEQHGVRCWVAPRDVTPGQPYADEIVHGIEGCAAFVLLATSASLASRNVLNELEQAHRSARVIYTVMVNQPKLPGDVSYYVARLHWLQTDGTDFENVADRLADVMKGVRRWEAVASPPSLTRSLRNMLPAFGGALAAVTFAVLLLTVFGFYLLRRERHRAAADYRSLGWVTLDSVAPDSRRPDECNGNVWLGDASLPFSRTTLQVVSTDALGQRKQFRPQLPPEATGQAPFAFALVTKPLSIDTRLAVPSSAENATFCIEQHFTINNGLPQQAGEPHVQRTMTNESCR